jgi:hypothetical protein
VPWPGWLLAVAATTGLADLTVVVLTILCCLQDAALPPT